MDSDKTQNQPPQETETSDTTLPSTIAEGEEIPKSGELIELTPEYRPPRDETCRDPEISHEGATKEPDKAEELLAGYVTDRSTRPQVLTERGLEFQQQLRARSLRTAINKWRRKIDEAEDRLADCDNVNTLINQRNDLSSFLGEVQAAAESLSEVAMFPEPVDRFEDETRQLRKAINGKIKELRDEARSATSKRSKGSNKEPRASSRSSKSMKLEVATKAAEFEVQLRYHDEEATLSKLRIKKDLEIAQAKLGVIKEEQEGSLTSQLLEEDSKGRVQDYINTIPSADFADDLGEPQFSLPPAQTVPGTSTRVCGGCRS